MSQAADPQPSSATDAFVPPASRPDMAPQILPSTALMQGQRSVAIEHNGAIYRLQITRQGKLILTK